MGRPRTPTAVLELRGAFRKNPQRARARADEPKTSVGIGDPPAAFVKPESPTANEHLAIWNELIEQVPAGVLTKFDRWFLEDVCRLKYIVRRGSAKTGDKNLLEKMMGKLGMNPADRSRNATGTTGIDDRKGEWAEYANQARPSRVAS